MGLMVEFHPTNYTFLSTLMRLVMTVMYKTATKKSSMIRCERCRLHYEWISIG